MKNPHGEASVHRDIGNLLSDTQPKKARAEYETSLAQFQAIGDRGGVASAYSDLGVMLWLAGDRDGSETAVRNVLQIRRETGDIAGQTWALTALAVEESDERASNEVIAAFREAAALDASIGAHSHRGFSLYSLSDIFRLRGQLEEARNACAEAQAELAKVNDPANKSSADFECTLIALDRGDVAAAEAGARRARDAAVRRGDTMTIANADLTLGQVKIGQGDCPGALPLFDAAERESAQGEMATGQAVATSFTALCAAAAGNARLRDAALARSLALRSRINERQEVIQADINLAELRGASGEKDQAISALQALADDARNRDWPGWAMEAELAQMRMLQRSGDAARAEPIRERVIAEARQKGFGWVLQRAQKR
jgi:ATP/maltotriose-dependent transcriptional regulator MalT